MRHTGTAASSSMDFLDGLQTPIGALPPPPDVEWGRDIYSI